jgi:hypothetical protein
VKFFFPSIDVTVAIDNSFLARYAGYITLWTSGEPKARLVPTKREIDLRNCGDQDLRWTLGYAPLASGWFRGNLLRRFVSFSLHFSPVQVPVTH